MLGLESVTDAFFYFTQFKMSGAVRKAVQYYATQNGIILTWIVNGRTSDFRHKDPYPRLST